MKKSILILLLFTIIIFAITGCSEKAESEFAQLLEIDKQARELETQINNTLEEINLYKYGVFGREGFASISNDLKQEYYNLLTQLNAKAYKAEKVEKLRLEYVTYLTKVSEVLNTISTEYENGNVEIYEITNLVVVIAESSTTISNEIEYLKTSIKVAENISTEVNVTVPFNISEKINSFIETKEDSFLYNAFVTNDEDSYYIIEITDDKVAFRNLLNLDVVVYTYTNMNPSNGFNINELENLFKLSNEILWKETTDGVEHVTKLIIDNDKYKIVGTESETALAISIYDKKQKTIDIYHKDYQKSNNNGFEYTGKVKLSEDREEFVHMSLDESEVSDMFVIPTINEGIFTFLLSDKSSFDCVSLEHFKGDDYIKYYKDIMRKKDMNAYKSFIYEYGNIELEDSGIIINGDREDTPIDECSYTTINGDNVNVLDGYYDELAHIFLFLQNDIYGYYTTEKDIDSDYQGFLIDYTYLDYELASDLYSYLTNYLHFYDNRGYPKDLSTY